jgi:hypothetical protein
MTLTEIVDNLLEDNWQPVTRTPEGALVLKKKVFEGKMNIAGYVVTATRHQQVSLQTDGEITRLADIWTGWEDQLIRAMTGNDDPTILDSGSSWHFAGRGSHEDGPVLIFKGTRDITEDSWIDKVRYVFTDTLKVQDEYPSQEKQVMDTTPDGHIILRWEDVDDYDDVPLMGFPDTKPHLT